MKPQENKQEQKPGFDNQVLKIDFEIFCNHNVSENYVLNSKKEFNNCVQISIEQDWPERLQDCKRVGIKFDIEKTSYYNLDFKDRFGKPVLIMSVKKLET